MSKYHQATNFTETVVNTEQMIINYECDYEYMMKDFFFFFAFYLYSGIECQRLD